MRSLFTRAQAPLLGVDVSASSVKLVELSQARGGSYVVEHCAIEPLQRGWVIDGTVDKFDEVAAALRRAVQRSGSRARQAALALPQSAVITRKIILPTSLSELELEQQIEAEAGQYIPFPLEEVNLDFCPTGNPNQMEGDQEILIAASRRDRVDDCIGLAEAAGLKAVVVDVETHAARMAANRAIAKLPAQGDIVVALFEIGAYSTSMHVLRRDEVVYERDQSFGGDQLTELAMRQYGFSQEEAELKKRENDLPDDASRTVLPSFNQSIAQEITRALHYCFSSTPFNRVDYILLAGGSAAVPGLDIAVTQASSFACRRLDPFEGMAMGSGVRELKLRQQAPSYLTACGLAMRRFLA